jgi:hypothetical protein
MAKIWLYIPFSDMSDDKTIRELAIDLEKSGMDFDVVKDDAGGKFLATVADDDLLLLGAHGLANYNSVFVHGANGREFLGANPLASRIAAAGLSAKHESVLLLTCSGGGESVITADAGLSSVPSTALKIDHGPAARDAMAPYKCFASVFAKALGLRHYSNILVGGFPGDVGQSRGDWIFIAKTAGGDNRNVLAEMDHIQWFDASGRTTSETYDRVSAYSRD